MANDIVIKYTLAVEDKVTPALTKLEENTISAGKVAKIALKQIQELTSSGATKGISSTITAQIAELAKVRSAITSQIEKLHVGKDLLTSAVKNSSIIDLNEFARTLPNVAASFSGLTNRINGSSRAVIALQEEMNKLQLAKSKIDANLGGQAQSVRADNRGYTPTPVVSGTPQGFTRSAATGAFVPLAKTAGEEKTEIYKREAAAHLEASQAAAAHTLALQKHQAESNRSAFWSKNLLLRVTDLVAGYRLVNFALNTFISGLQSIPTLGIQLENSKAVLKAVFLTTQQVNTEFAFLNALADKTGAHIASLTTDFGQFASSARFSGESIQKIESVFQNLTEAGTVLHLPEEKMRSVFTAVNQMYGKNQVMAEELKKQLGNQLPAAVSVFALSMGKSTKQLLQDMKDGLVLPKDTLAQFAQTYKDLFADADAFAIASKGLNAELGRLSTAWTRLAQDIYNSTNGLIIGAVKLATGTLESLRGEISSVPKEISKWDIVKETFSEIAQKAKEMAASIEESSANLRDTSGWDKFLDRLQERRYLLDKYLNPFPALDKLAGGAVEAITSTHQRGTATSTTSPRKSSIGYEYGLFGGQARDAAEAIKKDLEKDAIQLKIETDREKVKASIKEALILGSQEGSEELAKILPTELARALQTQASNSQAIITNAGIIAKSHIHALQKEQAVTDRLMRNNQLSVQQWLDKKLQYAEREYEITLRRLNLERSRIQEDLQLSSNLNERVERKITSITAERNQQIQDHLAKVALYESAGLHAVQIDTSSVSTDQSARINNEINNTETLKKLEEIKIAVAEKNAKGEELTPLEKMLQTDGFKIDKTFLSTIEQEKAQSQEFYKQDLAYGQETVKILQGISNSTDTDTVTLSKNNIPALSSSSLASSSSFTASSIAPPSKAPITIQFSPKLEALIEQNAARTHIDANLIRAVIQQESGGKQFDSKGNVLRSSADALGVMQIVPKWHPEASRKALGDMETNVRVGTDYLASLIKHYDGNVASAIAAYNAGQGNIDKNKGQPIASKNDENVIYLRNVLGNLEKLGSTVTARTEQTLLDKSKTTSSINRYEGRLEPKLQANFQEQQDNEYRLEQAKLELEEQARQYVLEKKNTFQQINIEALKYKETNAVTIAQEEIALRFQTQQQQIDVERADLASGRGKFNKEELDTAQANLDILKEQALIQADINNLLRTRNADLERMDLRVQAIQIQQDQRNETEFGAIYQRSQLGKEKVKYLEDNFQNSVNSLSPDLTPQEKDNKIQGFLQEIEAAKTASMELDNFFTDQLSSSIGQAFTDWTRGAASAEEAMKSLGVSILQMLQDIIIKELALAAAKAVVNAVGGIGGLFGFSEGGSVASPDMGTFAPAFATGGSVSEAMFGKNVPGYAGGGNILQFPEGGRVRGKGSETSDSIDAIVPIGSYVLKASVANELRKNVRVKLSNNEEVISPSAVQHIGKDRLDKLNFGGSFATGGMVGSSSDMPIRGDMVLPKGKTGTTINNFHVNVTTNGKEDGKELSDKIAVALMTRIAKKEANSIVGTYDKQQTIMRKRGAR